MLVCSTNLDRACSFTNFTQRLLLALSILLTACWFVWFMILWTTYSILYVTDVSAALTMPLISCVQTAPFSQIIHIKWMMWLGIKILSCNKMRIVCGWTLFIQCLLYGVIFKFPCEQGANKYRCTQLWNYWRHW